MEAVSLRPWSQAEDQRNTPHPLQRQDLQQQGGKPYLWGSLTTAIQDEGKRLEGAAAHVALLK